MNLLRRGRVRCVEQDLVGRDGPFPWSSHPTSRLSITTGLSVRHIVRLFLLWLSGEGAQKRCLLSVRPFKEKIWDANCGRIEEIKRVKGTTEDDLHDISSFTHSAGHAGVSADCQNSRPFSANLHFSGMGKINSREVDDVTIRSGRGPLVCHQI